MVGFVSGSKSQLLVKTSGRNLFDFLCQTNSVFPSICSTNVKLHMVRERVTEHSDHHGLCESGGFGKLPELSGIMINRQS